MKTVLPLLGLCLLLTACSTTRVVLVPDPDGRVGKVAVTTDSGSQTLDEAGEGVKVGGLLPSRGPEKLSAEEIERHFGATLRSEPEPPITFVLQFRHDSAELTEASAGQIPSALRQIEERESCYIVAAGHTDAVGDTQYNIELSLRRVNRVKALLTAEGIRPECIETLSYGENDPLIPTADNVAEPRNRRVELVIR